MERYARYYFVVLIMVLLVSCGKDESPPVVNVVPVDKKVNVILLIGDGMGLAQVTAARTVNHNLNLGGFSQLALVSTHSANNYITDSGASATAISTGVKTKNNYLGLDSAGMSVPTIVELLEKKGFSTGLITTSEIIHATPAAFFAHQPNRYAYETIALDLMKVEVDFFAGGGRKYFNQREDGLNLIDTLVSKGYFIGSSIPEIINVNSKKTGVFISDVQPLKYSGGRGNFLPDALEAALDKLSGSPRGFFIMVEGAQIDWACEDNDQAYMLDEMLDFDRAVGVALDYAKEHHNTLVVVVGDHETGGYALTGGSYSGGTVNGQFPVYHHTAIMVPLFAYGPGSGKFSGIMENNELFYNFLSLYNLK